MFHVLFSNISSMFIARQILLRKGIKFAMLVYTELIES